MYHISDHQISLKIFPSKSRPRISSNLKPLQNNTPEQRQSRRDFVWKAENWTHTFRFNLNWKTTNYLRFSMKALPVRSEYHTGNTKSPQSCKYKILVYTREQMDTLDVSLWKRLDGLKCAAFKGCFVSPLQGDHGIPACSLAAPVLGHTHARNALQVLPVIMLSCCARVVCVCLCVCVGGCGDALGIQTWWRICWLYKSIHLMEYSTLVRVES